MTPLHWFTRHRQGRVLVLGVDGMDAALTQQWMAAGDLPNLARLADSWGWSPLRTTNPAESPVAWASFATGLNPGKHGILDFLQRDPTTYRLRVGPLTVRARTDGGGLEAENHRQGQPFWATASQAEKRCLLLRVPGTCPPEPLRGKMLSGLGVPDLLGSWGTSWLLTTADGPPKEGVRQVSPGVGGTLEGGDIPGPLGTKVPLSLVLEDDGLHVSCQGQSFHLRVGQWSPWFSLSFRTPLGVDWRGMARFYLWRLEPDLSLYLSPVNIDPRQPCLPLTFPDGYMGQLLEQHGLFDTLGWPEDVSGLNAGRLDEAGFLAQVDRALATHKEMTLRALAEERFDLLISVMEALDRVQHMCWGDGNNGADGVIRSYYRRLDDYLGRIMEAMRPNDVLIMLSDHGFKPVYKLVHVNAWLRDQGYLVVRPGGNARSGSLWADVDWGRTRAYALGLSKVYVNLAGREGQGCVNPGRDHEQLIQEMAQQLLELRDEETGQPILRNVYEGRRTYSGAHYQEGGDLILGFQAGYRTSQRTGVGKLAGQVLVPNRARWRADHCSVDPALVPGVLLANRSLDWQAPSILDLAPTILRLLGVPAPEGLDGRALA